MKTTENAELPDGKKVSQEEADTQVANENGKTLAVETDFAVHPTIHDHEILEHEVPMEEMILKPDPIAKDSNPATPPAV